MFAHALRLPWLHAKRAPSHAALIGSVALAFEILSSSTYPVFGKELAMALSPLTLIFVSELMGGIFVALTFGIMPITRAFRALSRQRLTVLIGISVMTSIIGSLLWFWGLRLTTAVNAELFSRAQFLFLILLSVLLLHERISARALLRLSVIALGMVVVALQGFTDGIEMRMGDLLILTASLVYALGGVAFKRNLHNCPPELLIFTRTVMSGLVFFAVSPFRQETFLHEITTLSPHLIAVLFAYGFITKFLGLYSFHKAIDNLQVQTVSSVGVLSIVGGIAFAAVYLGEAIAWYHVVGGSLIIAGILLSKTHLRSRADWAEHEEKHLRQHHRHHL